MPGWFPRSVATQVVTALLIAACGGEKSEQAPAAAPAAPGSDLTPFQLEHGIGPITEAISLGPVDEEVAEAGKKLFEAKCSACHKMTERYVGPPLGDVTTRRTPAYVMNMMLNPDVMYTRHPAARQLLADYMTQMPNLALTQDDARKLLEYLRTQTTSAAGK